MSFVYKLFSAIIVVAVILIGTSTANAEKLPDTKYCSPAGQLNYQVNTVSYENLIPYKPGYKTQADNFVTIDSLSNAYSYFYLMINKPFVYDQNTGNLITVKRGYYNPVTHGNTGYDGLNRSYNILMRISEDYGTSWNDEVVVYDKDAIGYFEARYPTCYGFKMNDKQYVASTFPVINYDPSSTGGWDGYVSTLWNTSETTFSEMPMASHQNLQVGGNIYNWDNDSRIYAGEKPDAPGEYFWITASEISPENAGDFTNNSHIAMRRTDAIAGEILETIPDAWNSDKFSIPESAGRYNQLVDLKMSEDGILYMGVYGNYRKDDATKDANTVGVSVSNDYGLTWETIDFLPLSVREAFLASLGFAGGTFVFNYTTKSMVVFNGGEISFVVHGPIYNAAQEYQVSQIVEIFRDENQNWGMRTVAENTGSYITYKDVMDAENNRTNPSDIELQIARTVDGNGMVAKWIDLIGYDATAGTFTTTDVFMAARMKNATSWNPAVNVTQSSEIDRSVLIPDYITNFTDKPIVPMLKQYSKFKGNESERDSQFVAGIDQYLKYAVAEVIVDVEENEIEENVKVDIVPNPIHDIARVRVFYEGKPVQTEVAIYNLLGEKVAVVSNGIMPYGTHHFDYNVSNWISGTYYVTVTIGDKKMTKLMNIIK